MKQKINIILAILSIVNIVYSIKLIIDEKIYWFILIPVIILFGISCILAGICGIINSDDHPKAKNIIGIMSLIPIAVLSVLFVLLIIRLLVLKPIFYIVMAIITLICVRINKSFD